MKKSLIILFLSTSFLVQGQEVFPDSVQTNYEKAVYYNALAEKQSIVDSQLIFTKKALPFAKKSKNDSLLIATYYFQSYYNYYTSEYEKSLQQAIDLDSIISIKRSNFYSIKNKILLGQILIIIDEPLKALDYGNQALNLSLKLNDSSQIADSYYNLGFLYTTNEMNKQAKKYLLKSLEIYELIGADSKTKYGVSTGLIRVSETYEETLFYLNKTFELLKNEDNLNKIAYYYVNKGDVLIHWKQGLKESVKASKMGLKLSDSINNRQLVNVALLNISRAAIDLKNYGDALEPLNKLLNSENSNAQTQFLVLEALSKAHAGLKEFEKAYEYEKEVTALKDSIYSIKESNSFAEFDAKFKTAEKDKEITQQKLELAEQKSTQTKWIFGSLAFVLLGFTVFQWRNNKQRRQKLLAETKYKNEQEINELRTKFLGNIAHEIRTPLTLILGNLELAKENIDIKNKAIQNINIAITNSKKVVEDANEILELLKFEKSKISIKLNIVLLDATLKRIFLSFKSLAEIKKIKLQYQSAIHKNYQTKIDIEKVEKILNNLISNAVKYSPSNSEIIFYANIINSSLIIKITDFGQGIHFNETEKIFQRFYQASNSQSVGGIGIGLSLAKEFAELLKGTLAVKSEINKGSTFTFILPIIEVSNNYVDTKKDTKLINRLSNNSEKTPIKDQSISKNKTNKGFRKSKILIVEDNPEMNNYLAEILSDHYHCTTAFDGIEALQKMKNEKFDLITSDIMMPNLDGFQFRKKVNEINEYKNIPFILISAKTLTEDKIKGFQLGIDDYVIKPFDKNELLARIDNLLLHKGARDAWQINNKDLISNAESSDKKLLEKIKSIVIKNISDETFKINELSKNVGYSQRQLNRILKQYTGLSPVKFILEIRLQKAYQNLQNNTFFSLSEVRYDVGITSSSYFNKSFKNRFGIMPKDLLKNQ